MSPSGTGFLCTVSCDPTTLPADGMPGTEFIVLTIKNIGLEFVTLRGLTINDEDFSWSSVPPGTCLKLLVAPKIYPVGGTFSLVTESTSCAPNWEQLSSNVLLPGAEATLVVKLSDTLGAPNDLALNTPLRIKMDTEKVDLETFLIIVGSIK